MCVCVCVCFIRMLYKKKNALFVSDQILLHCTKVAILWQFIYALLGIKWVMPFMVWILCWEKEEENLENSFFVLVLDNLEGEK